MVRNMSRQIHRSTFLIRCAPSSSNILNTLPFCCRMTIGTCRCMSTCTYCRDNNIAHPRDTQRKDYSPAARVGNVVQDVGCEQQAVVGLRKFNLVLVHRAQNSVQLLREAIDRLRQDFSTGGGQTTASRPARARPAGRSSRSSSTIYPASVSCSNAPAGVGLPLRLSLTAPLDEVEHEDEVFLH
jgi:hypothetical protein